MCRHNRHSAGSLRWPFSMLKYSYIFFEQNTRKQFCQTALGNCYGLKLTALWLQFKRKKFAVSFIITFGTLSFAVQLQRIRDFRDNSAIYKSTFTIPYHTNYIRLLTYSHTARLNPTSHCTSRTCSRATGVQRSRDHTCSACTFAARVQARIS